MCTKQQGQASLETNRLSYSLIPFATITFYSRVNLVRVAAWRIVKEAHPSRCDHGACVGLIYKRKKKKKKGRVFTGSPITSTFMFGRWTL